MLRFIGEVLYRYDDANMFIEVITRLRIELAIRCREDLVYLPAEREGRAHLGVVERLVTIGVRAADRKAMILVIQGSR